MLCDVTVLLYIMLAYQTNFQIFLFGYLFVFFTTHTTVILVAVSLSFFYIIHHYTTADQWSIHL
jgi:hypothetical protein